MPDEKDTTELSKEIAAGVDDLVSGIESARADTTGKTDDKDGDEGDGPAAGDDLAGGDAATVEGEAGDDAVADEHLERAVKAGLTMAEARQYTSASHLAAMVSRLETAGKKADPEGGEGEGKPDGDGEDPLAAIPDLDPEEYDEKIVNGFKALKDFARQQQETIRALRSKEPSGPDWFKVQVSGLDKAVSESVTSDPTKMEAIRDKFSVLEAGYKAAKKDVSREAIFQEAVRITLGDVITKAAVDSKARQLAQRSKQHMHRPSGHRETPKGDPLEEVAATIDQKYFRKP